MKANLDLAKEIRETQSYPYSFNSDIYVEKQKLAASWMFAMQRAMLLDDAGAGKTMTSLATLDLFGQTGVTKAVILCPAAVIPQWSQAIYDILKWKTIIVEGTKAMREAKYQLFMDNTDSTILLTTFSTPLTDEKYMRRLNPDVIIYDEATALKNASSKIHKLMYDITSEEKAIFVLTATPVTLSLGDLYNLFLLLHISDVVGSYGEEVEPLLKKANRFGNHYKVLGAEGAEDFLSKIEPYYIRRTFFEVFEDVPNVSNSLQREPEIIVQPLKISKLQVEAFNVLKAAANRDAREGTYKPLTYWSDFYKVCSSPSLLDFSNEKDPKAAFAVNYVKALEDKAVIFVRYLEYQHLVENYLKDADISVISISGELSTEEQQQRIDRFKGGESQVLLLTEVGKYGLNLQVANHVILLSLPRNPADFIQLMGRVYRYGQEKPVKITICFMENTVEEDALRDLCQRQNLLDTLFKDTDLAKYFERDKDYVRGFLEKDYTSSL